MYQKHNRVLNYDVEENKVMLILHKCTVVQILLQYFASVMSIEKEKEAWKAMEDFDGASAKV